MELSLNMLMVLAELLKPLIGIVTWAIDLSKLLVEELFHFCEAYQKGVARGHSLPEFSTFASPLHTLPSEL